VPRGVRRIWSHLQRSPFDAAAWAVFAVASVLVVGRPLWSVWLPPMTDLPMHAAHTGMLRHFWDPSFHFQDQFTFHPLEVPYLSTYVLGALLSLVMPMIPAVKLATAVGLAMLPVGLALLAHGAKKSPLLGAAGLLLVWTNLTEWGFVNFVAATGLFAASVGLALLVLDRPTALRRVGLSAVLVVLFFTHVFRFPFAIGGIALAALATAPARTHLRALLLPLAPPLALFAWWTRIRPKTLDAGSAPPLDLHWERTGEMRELFFRSFHDPAERLVEEDMLRSLATVACVLLVLRAATWALALRSEIERPSERELRFRAGATLVPVGCAAACLLSYLVLPMQIGVWWYVYPREIVVAAVLALGALPDLPRSGLLRLAAVVAFALPALRMEEVVTRNWLVFDRSTRDLAAVVQHVPRAPKLLYLVFEHGGSTRTVTPYIHLPAYVQATKGGWLSFHFAVFGASPFRYRDRHEPGAVVPPPMMTRWEWRPDAFRMREHGAFFDWFLVRRTANPVHLFHGPDRIELVAHRGSWWLFRKVPPTRAP